MIVVDVPDTDAADMFAICVFKFVPGDTASCHLRATTGMGAYGTVANPVSPKCNGAVLQTIRRTDAMSQKQGF